MTSTIWPMLENCCCGCGGNGGCNHTWPMNVVSTNPDCLKVDTSECWVIKLEPVCPPVVVAGDESITVVTQECNNCEDAEEWDECVAENCSMKYVVTANCKDEKVKACPNDTTPGTLYEKVEAWHAVKITPVGCDNESNSYLRIDVDEDKLNIDFPPIEIENNSKLINAVAWWDDWHTIYISDREDDTYGNMVCIGFTSDADFRVEIDKWGNADTPLFMWENWHNWTIYTGNHSMATQEWIKILADGYYRLFWQITVQNNIDDDYYFNLWRWLLRINWDRTALNDNMYLSTAKHWAYARQMLLGAGSWIDVSDKWVISSWNSNWQTDAGYNWPWMTFNIDTLVDLKKDDIITVWYRPQSNNMSNPNYHDLGDRSSNPIIWTFRFVWQNDSSTTYNALFWGTLLWCYQLAPKRFQEWTWNEVYWTI